MASRHAARVPSTAGSAISSPSESRSGVRSRTCAIATSLSSAVFSRATQRNSDTSSSADGSRVRSNRFSRCSRRRWATSGCNPRMSRSSTSPDADGRKVKWWCNAAPLRLATVVVTRRTRPGRDTSDSATSSFAAVASSSADWSGQVKYRSATRSGSADSGDGTAAAASATACNAPVRSLTSAAVETRRNLLPSRSYSAVTQARSATRPTVTCSNARSR